MANPQDGFSLFGPDSAPENNDDSSHLLCAVALENSLDRSLTYLVPPAFAPVIAIGQRVKVPLGRRNRPAFGYVIQVGGPPPESLKKGALKRLLAIDDERVLITPTLMHLARWMSRYYVCPLGSVLETVIPSAVKKRTGMNYLSMATLAVPRDELQRRIEVTKQPKRRAVYARLLQLADNESIELLKLASEAGVKIPTVRKLIALGVIAVRSVPDLGELAAPPTETTPATAPPTSPGQPLALNDDQQRVMDALLPRLPPSPTAFSTSLLLGVTGSGKTEIYLQAISKVVAAGKQALVLVPEISLTPQTVRRFMDRFPPPIRVAYLHSGLTASKRHRQWQTILAGRADIVIGARSAVFAPLDNLGLIVVDEEHESSYKQDNAPRYHARDLAIKRAQLSACPILLASATPSLESYQRALSQSAEGNPAALLRLPRRVRGLSMPAVEVVDMKQELKTRRYAHVISARLEYLLRATLDRREQAILLLNRRGYSNFIHCAKCNEPLKCKYCDVTLTYHRNQPPPSTADGHILGAKTANAVHSGQLNCHYCLAVQPMEAKCPTCGTQLAMLGMGTQRVEEELTRLIPAIRLARVDSDTMRSGKDYESILSRFGTGDIQVLLGTQMIAKGLDFPNVTLVGVISADTSLALPDFRSAERTFQLITQVAGRAGRAEAPGRVVVQTFLPDDATIRSALTHDYNGFAARELDLRKSVSYPPFARLARIILRDTDEEKLKTAAETLATGLATAAESADGADRLTVKGPSPCPINKIAGHHRIQVLLSAPTASPIQSTLAAARESGLFKNTDRIAVDIDPVSLL